MRTQDFNYHLPEELIAQAPLAQRDHSRLLLLNAPGRLGAFKPPFTMTHCHFYDIVKLLNKNDLLIMNNSKVLPIRLLGSRLEQPGAVELFLLNKISLNRYQALGRFSAKAKVGLQFSFEPGLIATVLTDHQTRAQQNGLLEIEFSGPALDQNPALETWLEQHGHVPLPPYIKRAANLTDQQNYQTVYAKPPGSAAAPTAGLHFTNELLDQLKQQQVNLGFLTLNVGLGTFRPVQTENIADHPMHHETFFISAELAQQILHAKKNRQRIVAVGTTVVRALEAWFHLTQSQLAPGTFSTNIFIHPDGANLYDFKIVDDLITNFHLPQSTLLMLVAAAIGLDQTQKTYQTAIEQRYRFFSYGDALFIRGNNHD